MFHIRRYKAIPISNFYKALEKATQMPAHVMLRFEASYREKLAFAKEHPEIPAYLGTEIINQPKKR